MENATAIPGATARAPRDTAPVTIVIFGATGDLTKRLLFPALHRLMATGLLSSSTRLIGYAIEDWTTPQFVAHLHEGVETLGGGVDDAVWAEFAPRMTYIKGDLTPESMKSLGALIDGPTVFYLALPPVLFSQAATSLGEIGLANEDNGWRRLVIEKPFGTSLESAKALQAQLRSQWEEHQLYRIDHFLGKDTVHNLLVFRLANRFVEAIWNSANIAQVQITASETIGLVGRWRYYDAAGALRDMLQNHLMQLFALCAMEPLSVWDPEILREHKVEVLRAVRPFTSVDIPSRTVRGQYAAGTVKDVDVVAYRAEEHIEPTSKTETYAALQFFVDNWRWEGVPFSLRSGKHLVAGLTEIALELRQPPLSLFGRVDASDEGHWIVLRLRPDETIQITAVAKKAGLGMQTEHIVLTATDPDAGGADYSAYEQLLLDVISGDSSSYIRGDEALLAWEIVQPVLDAWAASGEPVLYPSGSDGPPPSPGFFPPNKAWRDIKRSTPSPTVPTTNPTANLKANPTANPPVIR
jgi:glucose-6-phosphate 1-dehydrogenase